MFFKPKFKYYKDHRETKRYKTKKRMATNVWLYSSPFLLIGANVIAGLTLCLMILGMFTTLMFLDETK